MTLATVLLAASLSLVSHALQTTPPRGRAQTVKTSQEEIAKLMQKRKALRSRVDVRRKNAESKIEAAQTAFISNQRARLDEANRKALERIKSGK